MAATTDVSPTEMVSQSGYKNKIKDEICESSDGIKQMKTGKPPRRHSVARHNSIGSAIPGVTDLVSYLFWKCY